MAYDSYMNFRDSYGHILIRVTEDFTGAVLLEPVSDKRKREISASNLYNHAHSVLYQDYQVELFMSNFPRATYRDHNGDVRINSNVCILIDSWTYRHMVGGQCG